MDAFLKLDTTIKQDLAAGVRAELEEEDLRNPHGSRKNTTLTIVIRA